MKLSRPMLLRIDRISEPTKKVAYRVTKVYSKIHSFSKPVKYSIAIFLVLFGIVMIPNPFLNGIIFVLAGLRIISDKRYRKLFARLQNEEKSRKKARTKRRRKRRRWKYYYKQLIGKKISRFQQYVGDAMSFSHLPYHTHQSKKHSKQTSKHISELLQKDADEKQKDNRQE